MARENQWGHRGAEWRDLTWAVGAAALVTVLLAVAVAVVWFIGRAPSQAPAVAVSASLATTPTPRALVFARHTPQVQAAAEDVAAVASAAPAAEPVATATPELLAISAAEASETVASGPILEASREEDFSALASGSWGVRDEQLFNEGGSPVA